MSTVPAHELISRESLRSPARGLEHSASKVLIRPHVSKIAALERLCDGLYIWASLWACSQFLGAGWQSDYSGPTLGALLLFNFFAEIFEVYYDWRGSPMHKEAGHLFLAWSFAAASLMALIAAIGGIPDLSGALLLAWIMSLPPVLLLSHSLFRLLAGLVRRCSSDTRRVAVVGCNDLGLRLFASMTSMPWLGYNALGFYDDRTEAGGRGPDRTQFKLIGGFDVLLEDAREGRVDTLYITLPLRSEKRIENLLERLADTTVSVYLVPDLFVFNLMHSRWTSMQGIPTVSVYESPFNQIDGFYKRVQDVIFASLLLALLAIPMLLVALIIRLTSPGPVIFKQRRYGMRGQTIEVLKFRTMTVCEDGDSIRQATRNDPRVTPFGRLLRSTSLDELPQLFNVLGGSMSLVGPRPHAVAHNEEYRKYARGYMLRHKVKPGITGLAQVSGCRGEIHDEEMLKRRIHFDLEYIRSWSPMLDFKILAMTAVKGLFGEQAY